MPTTTTIVGWVAILAVGGAYYWVNGQRKQKNRRSLKPKQQMSKISETRKDTKTKKQPKKDGNMSNGDQEVKQSQKKKAKQPAKPAAEEPTVNTSPLKTVERDEKKDNLEFARQLSNAKKGISDAPKSQAASRQKSVKQTRAQEKPVVEASEEGTAPSTGGDADDDESPINSPELSATTATNGDVSDMLEKPSGGPSVLRVTAPTNPAPAKKAKQQSFEVKETKKQKQNRKKAEEAKAAREADEKDRKVKLEAHRRSVREAEGRAAKDGTVFMASQAPSSSAWTADPAVQATNDTVTPASKKLELLDTYELSNGHVDTKPIEQVKNESKLAKDLALIDEDEQIRLAKEESNNWEQVKSKYPRKKKVEKDALKENKEVKNENASSSNDDSNDFGVPPVIAPTGPGKKWQMTTVHVEPNGKIVEREEEVQDSEWEVA